MDALRHARASFTTSSKGCDMRQDLKNIAQCADIDDVRSLRALFSDVPDSQVADELERLDRVDRAIVFRALPKDQAIGVFESFDPGLQTEILKGLREEVTIDLFADLDPDDRAGLLDELPAKVARKLLLSLSPTEREMTTALLGYSPDSVGRRMTPEVLAIPEQFSVGQALAYVRERGADAETVYLLPVIGEGRELAGVVSLRRLLFSEDATPIHDVMNTPVMIEATADREQAARLVRDEGLLALPVVDAEKRLLGFFTVDDAMRILESEESEDIARAGAAEPLRRPYLTSSILDLVRSRIVWLLVLIVAAALTVNVLGYFEATLAEVVALALFIPLLIGTGGNAGAQAATTVVRALASADIRFRDVPRIVLREVLTGLTLGAILAAIAVIPASLLVGQQIAIVLAIALVVVCTLATLIGSLIPLLAQRMGVDPAVVSAPFITTIVDTVGLIIYFMVARAVLGL
jgi:magnesium transporter